MVFAGGEELVVRQAVDEVAALLSRDRSSMVELVDAQSGQRSFVNPVAVAWVRALSDEESSHVGLNR